MDDESPRPRVSNGVTRAARTVARRAVPESDAPVVALVSPALVAVPATEAQNGFGRLVDQAAAGQDIAITCHNVARVVLVSAARYHALVAHGAAADLDAQKAAALDALAAQVDQIYARMQAPGAHERTIRALDATPEELGRAAVAAARRAASVGAPAEGGAPERGVLLPAL